MPNRILKESICTSDNLDTVSAEEEAFFYRLVVQCDDYGCLDARPSILLSRCYPLRRTMTEQHIISLLSSLVGARLVDVYMVAGRPYLHLTTWANHQQIRAVRRKYPGPEDADSDCDALDSICNHPIADAIRCSRNPIQSNPIQSERESNPKASPTRATRSRVPPAEVPPAVAVFRSVMSRNPPKAWYVRLDTAVTREPDALARWEAHCMEWIGHGYKPTDVARILESYQRGGLTEPAAAAPAPGGNGRSPRDVRVGDRASALEQAARKLGYGQDDTRSS
jgi:hypothetical protein